MSEMKSTPVMWMRGGTSKGVFFRLDDLPEGIKVRPYLRSVG